MITAHPYYVSVTEIEYDGKTRQMSVTCKFFSDDFEEALRSAGAPKLNLLGGDKAENKIRIERYVLEHLKISSGGIPVKLNCLGYENDREATWCYFEAEVPACNSISVNADFLYDTKKEQVNLFHITVKGVRKSSRLSHPERTFRADF